MTDVVSLGEMLIDFMPDRRGNLADVETFRKAPGGAPANVAVAVSRLGGQAAFIGKMGRDPFGRFLVEVLEREGIDTRGVVLTDEAKTGLAFVALDERGDRSFLFYRDPSADMLLRQADVNEQLLREGIVFHFGSVTQVHPESRQATVTAAQRAREFGKIVSFDVNLRLHLWPSLQAAVQQISETVPLCDILKVSEEEMEWLTGTSDLPEGSQTLLQKGPQLVVVTLGDKGTYYRTADFAGRVPAFRVQPVDTTGAGDAFVGGLLLQVCDRVKGRSLAQVIGFEEELREVIRYANAVGALTVTRPGAIPALPTKREVYDFMYAHRAKR
ncbi:PfkB family carbohydrate kinase [Effusibacillus pohliae]|uniref:PfkB family carbohydrate kinase n=1 Tax=Effusibacillus pohliae TaxID=232270 RepID=UPI0003725854|nr:PfkB family carbohydrate kinase [Effusibacillus pohliae]